MNFIGYFRMGVDDVWGVLQSEDEVGGAAAAASTPIYQVVDQTADVKASGNCSAFGSVTGAYRFLFTTESNFAKGTNYVVIVTYTVDSVDKVKYFTFMVI